MAATIICAAVLPVVVWTAHRVINAISVDRTLDKLTDEIVNARELVLNSQEAGSTSAIQLIDEAAMLLVEAGIYASNCPAQARHLAKQATDKLQTARRLAS